MLVSWHNDPTEPNHIGDYHGHTNRQDHNSNTVHWTWQRLLRRLRNMRHSHERVLPTGLQARISTPGRVFVLLDRERRGLWASRMPTKLEELIDHPVVHNFGIV